MKTNLRRASTALAATISSSAVLAGLVLGAGGASAASVIGWVGPAGLSYLDTSTIINAPNLTAQSEIYSTVGASAAPGDIGVRPRLFKSGALCEAIDFQYNFFTATSQTAGTTATCGTGSYNSHGFAAVWNANNQSYDQYVTFPSNPLNWTAPAEQTARATATVSNADRQSGVNAKGQSFGSAAQAETDPALVLAIGTNGEVGYVKASDLNTPPAKNPATAVATKSTSRSLPLTKSDGTTIIGTFTVE